MKLNGSRIKNKTEIVIMNTINGLIYLTVKRMIAVKNMKAGKTIS
jgi:hypothetical protein